MTIRFDPNARDGDGDGRVQDDSPFERPANPAQMAQMPSVNPAVAELQKIVSSTPEDMGDDPKVALNRARLLDMAFKRGVKADKYMSDELDEQDVADATNSFSLGKVGRQNAADAIIVREGENGPEVLMISRKFGPFKGAAALVGGFVDPGEAFEDAADREMMEEVGIDMSGVLQRTPLGYISDSYTWDPRFVDGANLGGVRYDVPSDIAFEAGDDALSAQWIPIRDIASGEVPVAFGHAAWLRAAFQGSDDKELASQLTAVARLAEHRNKRIIAKANAKRAELGEPLIPLKNDSWIPTDVPPTNRTVEAASKPVQWSSVDDIVDYNVGRPDADSDSAKDDFVSKLEDDWEQWKECRAIRQAAYRLAGQKPTSADPYVARVERNLFGDYADDDLFNEPVDPTPIEEQAKYLMGSLVEGVRSGDVSEEPLYRSVILNEDTMDQFFGALSEGAEVDIPLLATATKDKTGDFPVLGRYGSDAIIEVRPGAAGKEMRWVGAYRSEDDENELLEYLQMMAEDMIEEGEDEGGFAQEVIELVSNYQEAKVEKNFARAQEFRTQLRQIVDDMGMDGGFAGDEMLSEELFDSQDFQEAYGVREIVTGGRFIVESVTPDDLYGTRIVLRQTGVFDPANPGTVVPNGDN